MRESGGSHLTQLGMLPAGCSLPTLPGLDSCCRGWWRHRGEPPPPEDSRTWKGRTAWGLGTARTPGLPPRKGTLQGPQCPWDSWSLESATAGPEVVTALSGVSGLLLGAVWFWGAACPKALRLPPPPSLPGFCPAAWFLDLPPLGPGPRGTTCSCPDPPGPPLCGGLLR